ncbi:hypothetical protein M011DRAFT_331742 [Sporormia fimetaria CBS 119925]|uniref:Uncharacterized protein n=1 Tax=Sporormia fimetaria CBS 119925 TaxID=1340428 RepID=A0A6A6VDE2_9PLEO|nr:hypothetical protein M011DRAFT_331742 [Sporormia fimetaria CBS 119925]
MPQCATTTTLVVTNHSRCFKGYASPAPNGSLFSVPLRSRPQIIRTSRSTQSTGASQQPIGAQYDLIDAVSPWSGAVCSGHLKIQACLYASSSASLALIDTILLIAIPIRPT